jgi:hypothetical protein
MPGGWIDGQPAEADAQRRETIANPRGSSLTMGVWHPPCCDRRDRTLLEYPPSKSGQTARPPRPRRTSP